MMTMRIKLLTMLAVLGSATVFQLFPTSCAQLFTIYGLSSLNACAILNCESSTFFDICNPPLLVDCPQPAAAP